ncbi:NADP-dependent oxidoreductase [Teredinibacter turnerae]|uniref:NADP-dependent oxidoreductase n=1 Tax=Teredinibacter turnerae TaxID=2426 RepID=UPI0003F8BB31|nr:NADP-dependent oxidoreductase [Teredinibacter turnerae]
MAEPMKAVRIHAYGGADTLTLEHIDVPVPAANEVLVRIKAASVNPVDWKVRKGDLQDALKHHLPLTLGWDFAGEIAAVGSDVTDWQPGDAVYARPEITRDGTYAEYIAVNASEIAAKPNTADWHTAAAIPLVTLTAWQSLFDIAKLEGGQSVLVHAGAGGVGAAAIQLAKNAGARVFTTCSSANVDYVKSLGADEIIDYTKTDFSNLRDIDVVLDTLGGEVLQNSWSVLKPGGMLVSIVDTPSEDIAETKRVKAAFWFVQPNSEQLAKIATLFDEGKLKVNIDSVFKLESIADAHARSESGRVRGKVVVEID